jgi:hypothetical protein
MYCHYRLRNLIWIVAFLTNRIVWIYKICHDRSTINLLKLRQMHSYYITYYNTYWFYNPSYQNYTLYNLLRVKILQNFRLNTIINNYYITY